MTPYDVLAPKANDPTFGGLVRWGASLVGVRRAQDEDHQNAELTLLLQGSADIDLRTAPAGVSLSPP